MSTDVWLLVLKTGGMAAVIVIPIAWLFRKGGSISLNADIGPGSTRKADRDG